jgi:hypothetical protein
VSEVYWANPVSGQFDVGSNWVGGAVPGGGDDAFLESGDGGYTVTDSTNQVVGTVNIGAGVTLDVSAGTMFGAFGGFGSVHTTNSGLLEIGQFGEVELSNSMINIGTIELDGGDFAPVGLTLSGGGTVEFDGQYAQIRGTYRSPFLNLDNTIVTGSGNGLIAMKTEFINGGQGEVIKTPGYKLKIAMGNQLFSNSGLVEAEGRGRLTILSLVLNDGVIESMRSSIVIDGTVTNNGLIESVGGTIKIEGKVYGNGTVDVIGGTVTINGLFSQPVTFGNSGTLTLADATRFKAAVTGFSGSSAFDLGDIGFVSAGEATFKGSAASGRLTVTDGVHTARIALTGDYLGATFTATSNGHGGVIVTETGAALQRFAAAAASLTSTPGVRLHEVPRFDTNKSSSLAQPHT